MQILTGLGDLGKWPGPMAFSPDGRCLGAGDKEAFRLWDLSGGPSPVWTRPQFNDYLKENFAFAPDVASVVGGRSEAFARYDIRTGVKGPEPFLKELQPLAFAPDGRLALGADADRAAGVLRLRCARAKEREWEIAWSREITFDTNSIGTAYRILQFSADGTRFVRVFRRERSLRNMSPYGIDVFDADTGEPVGAWTGELPTGVGAGASASERVALLNDRSLYGIDTTVPASNPVKRVNDSIKHFTSVAFSRDGTRLATTSNDTAATIWDTGTWEVKRRYEWQIGRLRTVAFAPDGLRCAAGSDTGQIVVWDVDE